MSLISMMQYIIPCKSVVDPHVCTAGLLLILKSSKHTIYALLWMKLVTVDDFNGTEAMCGTNSYYTTAQPFTKCLSGSLHICIVMLTNNNVQPCLGISVLCG